MISHWKNTKFISPVVFAVSPTMEGRADKIESIYVNLWGWIYGVFHIGFCTNTQMYILLLYVMKGIESTMVCLHKEKNCHPQDLCSFFTHQALWKFHKSLPLMTNFLLEESHGRSCRRRGWHHNTTTRSHLAPTVLCGSVSVHLTNWLIDLFIIVT